MIRIMIPLMLLAVNAVHDVRTKTIFPYTTILTAAAGVVYGCICSKSAAPLAGLIPGGMILLFSKAGGGKIGMGDGLAVCAEGAWNGALFASAGLFFALTAAVLFESARRLADVLLSKRKRCSGRDFREHSREIAFVPFLFLGYLFVTLCW